MVACLAFDLDREELPGQGKRHIIAARLSGQRNDNYDRDQPEDKTSGKDDDQPPIAGSIAASAYR